MHAGDVQLGSGQLYVVRRGVQQQLVSVEGAKVMLIEPPFGCRCRRSCSAPPGFCTGPLTEGQVLNGMDRLAGIPAELARVRYEAPGR